MNRYPALSAFAAQVKDALVKSKTRMDEAHVLERLERKQRREGAAASLGKHPVEAESSETAAKRARMETTDGQAVESSLSVPPARLLSTTGREIDISSLPEQMVIEMVMRGLEAISSEALTQILNVSLAERETGLMIRQIARLYWKIDRMLSRSCVKLLCRTLR